MSNPLIRPNDPRFQRPPLTDNSGNNPFADEVSGEAQASQPTSANDAMFAAPTAGSEPAYRPEYTTGQPSRQRLIFVLVGSSLAAIGSTAIAMWLGHWLTYPLLLIALPTAAVGWYIAADELSVIRKGGVEPKHRTPARLALGLAIFCTMLAIGLAYAAIQQRIGFPE